MLPTNSLQPPSATPSFTNWTGKQSETESKASEEIGEQLEALRQQLDQAQRMATLGELTSVTTHEFNNLLMTILNYAKLGLRHQDQATRDKALQRIYDAASKASRLTNGILSLARNRSGAMEPTNIRPVIEDSILLLEREFKRKNVRLETDLQAVSSIMGSGNDLQRLVINLIVNAEQATESGGLVQIKLTEDEKQRCVVLCVRDNGCGIPAEVLPKIFEPYFTTKTGPDSSGRGGTGIGLCACKQIVDSHNGRIRVESTAGKGTAFTIRFPSIQLASVSE